MNELIQALGQYTEALEAKITALEAKVASLEERIAEIEAATPEVPEIPEQPEIPEVPEEPELALEPEEPEEPAKPETPEKPETSAKQVDIRQMISLGDRFLFQRELFGQNGEKMQRALDEINGCATEQEALDYIDQHFEWDKKSPTYELFINAIHRSYSGR